MIEVFLPSRYWLPLPFCTQRLLHVLHVQHSLKHPINYPTCRAARKGENWLLVRHADMSHSGHLLVTQISLGQVCPGDSGLYALLKCERNQLPSENRQVDGHGGRGGKIRNPTKSQSVWPCVDWPNIDMEWQQDLCLTTHYIPLHAFFLRKVQWLISEMGTSLPFGFVMIQPAVFWKVIFPSVIDFFLLLGKVVATKTFNSIPGEIIATESLGYEERSCVQRLLKQCWFDHHNRNPHFFWRWSSRSFSGTLGITTIIKEVE